jgi:hypothetical protein
VEGNGTIRVPGGQASFSMNLQRDSSGRPQGTFAYTDSAAHFSLSSIMFSTLTFSPHHAQFTGSANTGPNTRVTFTVNVNDNGDPGSRDTFALMLSNGYSASGNLTSGNIQIH